MLKNKNLKHRFNFKILILIIILIIMNSLCMIGVSYYNSIKNYFKDYVNNNYEFRQILIYLNQNVSQDKLINKLKNNPHVEDVFTYNGHISGGTITKFINNQFDGIINIIGTYPQSKKIVYGNDLNIQNENEIICPKNFYPDSSYIILNNYNINKRINMEQYVGKTIDIKYVNKENVKFKLVGLYDESYDFTDSNICYVTHETLYNLNDLYQPSINNDNYAMFVVLDNLNNVDDILNYPEIMGYDQYKTIKLELANDTLLILEVILGFLIIFIFAFCYLIYSRKIKNDYKNIGIKLVVGYSKHQVKLEYFKNSLLVIFIALGISLIISEIICNNFSKWFLYNDMQLSYLNVVLSYRTILLALFLTFGAILLSFYISMKKIDYLEIGKIVNE